ncbi:RHS repeat-associated core domain-containing protein [Aeromonas sp. AE23HZ002T15]
MRDDESGLCYNRFRYYDPQGACYISPDPIGIWGGENNYGYVHNPLGWIDPLGLSACAPTHHLATNKHSTWSDRFRELFKKNDLGKFKNGKWRKDVLNDPLNKIDVPGHKGPHPQDMHQEIFDRLSAASDRGKDAFIKEIEKLRVEAITPGSWLNDILTKVGK